MKPGIMQPNVKPFPNMLIGAALLTPGFCEDLTTWRLSIDVNGNLLQDLKPTCIGFNYESASIHLQSRVSNQVLAKFQSILSNGNFGQLNRKYTADLTDMAHTSITIKSGAEFKRVSVYGLGALISDNKYPELSVYSDLWDEIVNVSLYRSTTSKLASAEQARFMFNALYG